MSRHGRRIGPQGPQVLVGQSLGGLTAAAVGPAAAAGVLLTGTLAG